MSILWSVIQELIANLEDLLANPKYRTNIRIKNAGSLQFIPT